MQLPRPHIILDPNLQAPNCQPCRFSSLVGSVANLLTAFRFERQLLCRAGYKRREDNSGMIDFKGSHYPKSVILHAVFFYVRYVDFHPELTRVGT